MKKVLSVLFILILACAVLASCGEPVERDDYDIVKAGKSGYSIIRAEKSTAEEISACLKLKNAILELTGADIPILLDADAEANEKEILFGSTNREESYENAVGLECDDYRIASYGEKLVISGASVAALANAVDCISEQYFTSQDITLSKDLSYNYVTPIKTYLMSEIRDRYKTMGRTAEYGNAVSADWSAAGIEFNAECKNDVIINVTLSASTGQPAGTYFTVYIDGVRQEKRFLAEEGNSDIVIAAGLEEGVHSFAFYKQAHNGHCNVDINSITVEGRLIEKPADRDIYIEFVGDSITAGYGAYAAEGTTQQQYPYSDGTQSYGFFLAEKLNADYSLIARCSWGILAGADGKNIPLIYKYICYSRSMSDLYDFARKPDIVVVNIGTNDFSQGLVGANFSTKTEEFIKDIKEQNGDVPVIFLYGMMNNTGYAYINKAVRDYGGESAGVYTLEIPLSRSGGGGHPSVEEHKTAADLLYNFINEKNLLKK